jgi:lysylphosphatidylglycerol synthetase-like protein (DUF2156 family)
VLETEPEPERRVARPAGRIDRMLERADERPKPPWHPVPLVELSVLAGIVLLVVGFFNARSSHGRLAIGVGLVLASLAGLDTAAREHFAGYRSHSSLLAGLPAVATLALLALAQVLLWIGLLAAVAVFAIVFWLARGAFKRRAGVGFKVR